jgi:hypothetical protein
MLAGCAGSNFVRPDTGAWRTARRPSRRWCRSSGAPRTKGSVVKNDRTLDLVHIRVRVDDGVAGTRRRDPARRAHRLLRLRETLVGHEFVSSWAEDATDFDETKTQALVKGNDDARRTWRVTARQARGERTCPR